MSLVGKLFPNVAIDAMSEMGDDLKINIFEQAVNNQQKVLYSGIRKISLSFVQQNYTRFKRLCQSSKKEIQS